MRHFQQLTNTELLTIFYQPPKSFNRYMTKEKLGLALGATMYTPATNANIAEMLIQQKYPALTSHVLCLEDAIGDHEVEKAEENLLIQLNKLEQAIKIGQIREEDLPILFIRVRTPDQLNDLLKKKNSLSLIAGFNLPKFSMENGERYLSLIKKANRDHQYQFYAMPILETPETMYLESRRQQLEDLSSLFEMYESNILNIRLGGTDFSSLYGMRRGVDFTIYDVQVIRDVISDVVNFFGRSDHSYIISGCVWEYFADHRLLKPQLRATPFYQKAGSLGMERRKNLIEKEIDGLIREVLLDKANGLTGKTVIHPSHVPYVNALQVVTYEEYLDAKAIIDNKGSGVVKSEQGNKMNEIKPHYSWAKKIINKADIYGVLLEDKDYVDLF